MLAVASQDVDTAKQAVATWHDEQLKAQRQALISAKTAARQRAKNKSKARNKEKRQ